MIGAGSVLDLGCGTGILGRRLKNNFYTGIDLAKNLIKEARRLDKYHQYLIADITQEIKIDNRFDWATMILTLQNLKRPFGAMANAKNLLKRGGKLLIVINHPCFRIPRHSDWLVKDNEQYRMVETYMTNLEIPIESSPFDKKNNQLSWSYHYPLSAISEMLGDNGFLIEKIEEWVSDKKSEGGRAKIEDRARREFPLFMAITAKKDEK